MSEKKIHKIDNIKKDRKKKNRKMNNIINNNKKDKKEKKDKKICVEKRTKKKRKDWDVINIKLDLCSASLESSNNENSSYYRESNYCNRNIVGKHRTESEKEIDKICKKHRLKHDLLWLLVELDYDSELHYTITVSRLMYNYYYHRDWKYFINK